MNKLVLIPFLAELKATGFNFSEWNLNTNLSSPLYISPDRTAAILICGQGKVNSALALMEAYNYFGKIDETLLFGAAGGVAESPDLLITTSCIELDFISHNCGDKRPNFNYPKDLANELLEIARLNYPVQEQNAKGFLTQDITNNFDPLMKVEFGSIASSDRDIISNNDRSVAFSAYRATGFAWESAGFARSARRLQIPYGELRVIVDRDPLESSQDFLQLLRTRMKLAKPFLESYCKNESSIEPNITQGSHEN